MRMESLKQIFQINLRKDLGQGAILDQILVYQTLKVFLHIGLHLGI